MIDLTVVWSGPSACRTLAALGAEVIRVESLHHFPATSRGAMPYPDPKVIAAGRGLAAAYPNKVPGPDPYNRAGNFLLTATGKGSVTMELDRDEGRAAFHRLVERSDVMVENNSKALGAALGFGWEELGALNPRLILVRMLPMGLTGPYSDAIGFGASFEALAGMASLRAHPGAKPDEAGPTYHMDDTSPQGVVFAVLAALRVRERTGRGQFVEFPQGEFLMQGVGDVFLAVAADGRRIRPDGNRHPSWVQGCYPCRGDDQWIAITLRDDGDWEALVELMGTPGWTQEDRFASMISRREHQDELDGLIGGFTSDHNKKALFLTLQELGVPAGPVLDEADAYSDPHFAERGVFRELDHPSAGRWTYPSFGVRFSGMDLAWGKPAPLVGQDNEYVYKELLGYSDEEYEKLLAQDLIGTTYAPDVEI